MKKALFKLFVVTLFVFGLNIGVNAANYASQTKSKSLISSGYAFTISETANYYYYDDIRWTYTNPRMVPNGSVNLKSYYIYAEETFGQGVENGVYRTGRRLKSLTVTHSYQQQN